MIKNIPMYEFKDRSKILNLISYKILTHKSHLLNKPIKKNLKNLNLDHIHLE